MEPILHPAIVSSFVHFYDLDFANAQIHLARPRFSPITFGLLEAMDQIADASGLSLDDLLDAQARRDAADRVEVVRRHVGAYALDGGR